MVELLFISILSIILMVLSIFGIRYFPGERFQFLFAIPYKKLSNGSWLSLNITFYGLFNAIAYTLGSFIGVLLLISVGLTRIQVLTILITILSICIPSSKIIAKIIEKSKSGFTVGGAVFVGVIVSPFAVIFAGYITNDHKLLRFINPIIASLSIAYLIGEGVGRLGCISFGCCYGKSVDAVKSRFLRQLFKRFNTIYNGRCKKVSYASGLCNVETVPVQAMANILYSGTALISITLFIKGLFFISAIVAIIISQLYRFFSEFLRADYRGEGKISPYQKMALMNIVLSTAYLFWGFTPKGISVDLQNAFVHILELKMIFIFFAIFFVTLIYTGVSSATYSILTFRISPKVVHPIKPE